MADKTTKILRFKEAFPTYADFERDVVNPIKAQYVGADWADDAKMYTKWQTLYEHFIDRYGVIFLRYGYAEFLGYFKLKLISLLPNLYVKQSSVSNETLSTLTKIDSRGLITDVVTKIGGTDSPFNEGDNIDLNGSNVTRKQQSEAKAKTYDALKNLVTLINTKVSTFVKEFVDAFVELFANPTIQAQLEGEGAISLETLYNVLKASLEASAGVTLSFDDVKEKIKIIGSNVAHMLNGNTDPTTETITFTDNDLGGTYNIKDIVDAISNKQEDVDLTKELQADGSTKVVSAYKLKDAISGEDYVIASEIPKPPQDIDLASSWSPPGLVITGNAITSAGTNNDIFNIKIGTTTGAEGNGDSVFILDDGNVFNLLLENQTRLLTSTDLDGTGLNIKDLAGTDNRIQVKKIPAVVGNTQYEYQFQKIIKAPFWENITADISSTYIWDPEKYNYKIEWGGADYYVNNWYPLDKTGLDLRILHFFSVGGNINSQLLESIDWNRGSPTHLSRVETTIRVADNSVTCNSNSINVVNSKIFRKLR